ncbi:hypothetical protein [Rhodococcus sp. NCIMB 12038]|nr:hypothetical protein [Rhodococcus sp. NCIMB 12038]
MPTACRPTPRVPGGTLHPYQVVARNALGKLVLLDRSEDDDDVDVARAS